MLFFPFGRLRLFLCEQFFPSHPFVPFFLSQRQRGLPAELNAAAGLNLHAALSLCLPGLLAGELQVKKRCALQLQEAVSSSYALLESLSVTTLAAPALCVALRPLQAQSAFPRLQTLFEWAES